MKISVVIPIYKVEHYLKKCIDSVMNQTYTNFEVILVEDGSPDNSGLICDEYAKKDNRVKVIHKSNEGASVARNLGVSIVQGEYIIFLDADDYWLSENVLEIIVERLTEKHPDVLTVNFCKSINNELRAPYFPINIEMPPNIDGKEAIEFIIKNNLWIACPWNKVIRKKMFWDNKLKFTEGVTAEDVIWCAELVIVAEEFDYLGVELVGYVQREGSVSNSMTFRKVKFLKQNIDEVEHCMNSVEGIKTILLKQYLAYQIGTLLLNVACLETSDEKEILQEDIKRYLPYLKYSTDKKIKIMAFVNKILGYKVTLLLLRIYNTIRK